MQGKRVKRLNSLLKEVIAEVISKDVNDPRLAQFVSVTEVDITKDLHHAKVYISVLGMEKERRETIEALDSASGFIAVNASKKVTMRYFPALTFKLDTSVDKHILIDNLLEDINDEQQSRERPEDNS
ncbi:MAG: Ribosome-binding factor A [Chlamydiae bacterium]|nr:Ribosome-binding factor A [Chlamydiota bacterium]